MMLDNAQRKIVTNKQLGYGLLRGSIGTGKTTAAVYRGVYLKNQYCIYDDDKILITTKDEQRSDSIKKIYKEIEDEGLEYITLFSSTQDKLYFNSIRHIVNKYFLDYMKKKKNKLILIEDEKDKLNIAKECIEDIKKKYKDIKFLDIKYCKFYLEEIEWIKDCMYYSLDEYQEADRIGRKVRKGEGPQRLLKNSKIRDVIFKLLLIYNEKLKEKNLLDYADVLSIALKEAKKDRKNKFAHIIVDEAERFTKLELVFIDALCRKEGCFSILFVVDKDIELSGNQWITKGRKLKNLQLGFEFKRYCLNKKINFKLKEKEYICTSGDDEFTKNSNRSVDNDMDRFEYIDIKHGRSHKFLMDLANNQEIIVEEEEGREEYKLEDLKQLPLFNDIAAGEPILMNPYMEGEIYLPKYWLKGMKDCFVLKVKGNSMIGVDINDGDHVVIRKQYSAQNNDIVAVNLDGNATLKRLVIKKYGAILMPENKNYSPIPILEEGASIIGVAVGILKTK